MGLKRKAKKETDQIKEPRDNNGARNFELEDFNNNGIYDLIILTNFGETDSCVLYKVNFEGAAAGTPTCLFDPELKINIFPKWFQLKDINKEGVTVIIVTHETDVAKMTNRIINIEDGIIKHDRINK